MDKDIEQKLADYYNGESHSKEIEKSFVMRQPTERNVRNANSLYEYQSIRWDMNIRLEDLLEFNDTCRVEREYKSHKSDNCFDGYCMYLKHPNNEDEDYVMIGIWEDGFTYLGDTYLGGTSDIPLHKTIDIVIEMFFYGEWFKAKQNSLNKLAKLNDKIELEYKRLKDKLMNS